MSGKFRDAVLEGLESGKSLVAICREDGMPNRSTVQRWQNEDAAFDAAVTRAREDGYQDRAERALAEAKSAKDASLGRLSFDAERWYLGKLSNAFSDNKKQELEHTGRVVTAIEFRVVDNSPG